MMRRWIIIAVVCLTPVLSAWYVFRHASYPENAILGEWEEVSWTYDKIDEQGKVRTNVSPDEREGIANHLVVHKYENWIFSRPYALTLLKHDGREQRISWRLKDRGRILQLSNQDGTREIYSIETLHKDELVLHFETEVHARGIVKIRLKKKQSNVEKIQ